MSNSPKTNNPNPTNNNNKTDQTSAPETGAKTATALGTAQTHSEPLEHDSRFGDDVKHFKKFDDMELSDGLLRGIYAFGFEQPSVIQQKAIVPISQGRDVIMQAQSGTGKTGAFAIGVLTRVEPTISNVQVIVLSPTRELAQQTETVFAALGDFMEVRTFCAIGGTRVADDAATLRGKGAHVVCGTPGRLLDHIRKGILDTRQVKAIVIDEVDVMLSVGFKEQVQDLFRALPAEAQAVAVSATLSAEVIGITECFLRSPTRILIPEEQIPLEAILQFYVDCDKDAFKTAVLCDLFEVLSISKTVIFCNSRQTAERLGADLNSQDFSVSVLHSELTPQERLVRMSAFRHGSSRVLIATDILARGIDVQQVSIVVNYDIPRDVANYIHRIGRGGRHGRKAVAINLVIQRDAEALRDIERHYKIAINEMPIDVAALI